MESFSLTWRYLLDHPATTYFAPMPWHLLAVLVLLGLLAAGGLHHLLGYTFRFYRVPGGTAGWLALPSFAVLLVSMQVLIAIYLTAALAADIVRFALASPAAQASVMPIGNILLAPAFSGGGDAAQGLNQAGLNRALHAYSAKELRANFRRQLDQVRARPISLSETPDWDESASPELLLHALRWAAEGHENWPPAKAEEPRAGQDHKMERSSSEQTDEPTLSRSILSLVEEIGAESDMARRDWAHVAGNRFVQRVLEPMMIWQLRWLAGVTLVLLLVTSFGAMYLLGLLKRLVHPAV